MCLGIYPNHNIKLKSECQTGCTAVLCVATLSGAVRNQRAEDLSGKPCLVIINKVDPLLKGTRLKAMMTFLTFWILFPLLGKLMLVFKWSVV